MKGERPEGTINNLLRHARNLGDDRMVVNAGRLKANAIFTASNLLIGMSLIWSCRRPVFIMNVGIFVQVKILAAHYKTGKVREFIFRDGRLVSGRSSRAGARLLYGPGFFDIQCNGFAGIDFNHPDFSVEGLRTAVRAMWRYGTTHVMPTIVTGDLARMTAGMKTIAAACRMFPEIRASVPGIHQEGPFFANVEGVRGAHPPDKIIPPRLSHFGELQRAADGMIRMITLAPEIKGANAFIRTLSRRGVVVAIGHTNATPSEITDAVNAGARTSTHLGNGSAQILPRHHNYILAQLGEDRLYSSFIADGHHLPSFVLRSFFRAKPPEKRILTTDCMAGAGAPPGRYTIGWLVVEVGRNKLVRQPGKPNFAGSAITMTEGVANAVRLGGATLREAWDMSSVHPWNLMRGSALMPPPRVDDTFIIAGHHRSRLEIRATIMGGRLVYPVRPGS